ncbi:MAG: CHAT domain-containing protein [Candidatus Velthaea sp.]
MAAQQLCSAPNQEESVLLATLDASSFHYQNSWSFTAAAGALFEELESVFRESRPSGTHWKARMAELGSAAWEALPQTVRDILHPHSNIDVLISGDSYWTAFPWEALRFGPGEDDYLGWSRPLTRWSALTAAGTSVLAATPSRGPERSVAIVCPWDADPRQLLKGSRDEALALARDLPLRDFSLTTGGPILGAGATQASIKTALSARPAFFHFTGHGGFVREEETLLLHGGTFGSSQIRALQQEKGWADGVFAGGALIVLNCCFTGRTRMHGGHREDLTGVFLEQGARGVIASALPVYDPVGQVLGMAIYAVPGSTGIGAVVTTIRKMIGTLSAAAESPFYPTWSMIQYHGDPWLAMPSAPASLVGVPMPGLIEAVASWLKISPERAATAIAEFMH